MLAETAMRLIFLFAGTVTASVALGMFLFRAMRRTYHGFASWIAGVAIVSVGYLMIGLRGVLPDWITIVASGPSFPLGLLLHLDGLRRFLGLSPVPRAWYPTLVAGVIGTQAALLYSARAPEWQPMVTSLPSAAALWAMAVLLVRATPIPESRLYAYIAALLAVGGAVIAGRAVLILGMEGFNPLQESPLQAFFFILVVVLHLALTSSMILLHTDRLERELRSSQRDLGETVRRLEQALSEVKELRGVLPICSSCKKIRDDSGHWHVMEVYVLERSRAQFSHGICPACTRRLYPDMADEVLGE